MPRFPLSLPGMPATTLDTDNPAEFGAALTAHVDARAAAAVLPVQTALDAASAILVSEAVRLRTARLGAATVDVAALTERLGAYTPTQLSDFISDERAETARLSAPVRATTDDGAPETEEETPAAPAALNLSAFEDAPTFVGTTYAGSLGAAVVALFLFALSAFANPAAATVPGASFEDAPAIHATADAPATATDATPAGNPRSPLAPVSLALGAVGLTIFSRLRAFWGDCFHVAVATPAGGYLGLGVYPVGAELGICREDYTEGQTAMMLLETTDAGIEMPKAAGAIDVGAKVYWNPAGSPVGGVAGTGAVTTAAGGGTLFGYAVEAAAAGDPLVRFRKVRNTAA